MKLNKTLVRILSCFIFQKEKRQAFRQRYRQYPKGNDIDIHPDDRGRIHLHLVGQGNKIVIGKMRESRGTIHLSLAGNHCRIEIGEGLIVSKKLVIFMGQDLPHFGLIENSSLSIGERTSFESGEIVTLNSNASISVGRRCMFASDTTLFHTDAHPIMDAQSGKIINKVRDMVIGDHVWIGNRATVLKNTHIPHDSIVGYNSVVAARYAHAAAEDGKPGGWIIAGNPAQVVKTGVTWDADSSQGYVQNEP